jgi:pyruvate formate lyase activating enzyme
MECPYCERRCRLDGDRSGFCRMYTVADGKVVERFPRRYSSIGVSHIESVPFFHFQPGSRTLVLGGAGCDFDCQYCSNSYVARAEPEPLLVHQLAPERVVAKAKQAGCHSIAFSINEPTVALPTLLELSRVAAFEGIPVGVLTNGYLPPEIAEEMARAFRFVNVSLKGATDGFYKNYAGVPSVAPVKRTIEIFSSRTHLEVNTPVVQGVNDQEIGDIASFIASVDPSIPWHIFRLLPEYRMASAQRPDIREVAAAVEGARSKLRHVYFGNFPGSQWVSSSCEACGATLVERTNVAGCAAKPRTYGFQDGSCSRCGAPSSMTGGRLAWNSADLK